MNEILSFEQVFRLPPMILGVIRWERHIGEPSGSRCGGFHILVEERTATQFRVGSGGRPEPIPGTGIWKTLSSPVRCFDLPDEGEYRGVQFYIAGLNLNAFPDGGYRVAPTLKGGWRSSRFLNLGFRTVEPFAQYVVLKEGQHIQNVEFEVVHHSWRYRFR
jgi:hypothetical protein